VTFDDALELIMALPGKMAKEMCMKFSGIIKRYLAGDETLVKEIKANAASAHPIAQMARESLGADNAINDKDMALERRKRKIELDTMESQARFEDERRKLQIQNEKLQFIKSLSQNGEVDDQVRMLFKDSILNSVRNDSGQVQTAPDPTMQPLCLSSVATELGYKFSTDHLLSIGKTIKERYVAKYGALPGKHEQFVNGAVRMVNLYTKRDRAMVEQAMKEFQERQRTAAPGKTLIQIWGV
jgi:hypothetical protein